MGEDKKIKLSGVETLWRRVEALEKTVQRERRRSFLVRVWVWVLIVVTIADVLAFLNAIIWSAE